MTDSLSFIAGALQAMVIFPMFLLGQGSVTLTGVVEDESRAAVAGAKVVLMNQTSSQTQEAVSGAAGSFSFLDLFPGDYVLKVGATGFDPHQQVLTIRSQEPKPVRIILKVASVATQLTVTLDEDEVSSSGSSAASTKFDDDLIGAQIGRAHV